MQLRFKVVLLFCLVLLKPGCTTTRSSSDWQLVWSDEFNYHGLPDPLKWNYDTIGNTYGWGNKELQYYTYAEPKNVWVEGGFLHIKVQKERIHSFDYTSARLTTRHKGDWKYGRVEVRAKLPGGRGIWPAIWMLPTDSEYGRWPNSGEIDIVEHVGFIPDSVFVTVHTETFNHMINTQKGTSVFLPQSEYEFHIYAVEWCSEKIDFIINDELVFTFNNSGQGSAEWPFDQKFHLLLNVAVGGNWGGQQGVDDSIFPAAMLIDYVRVYRFRN
ncbi:glycoside hydrolase family 16 protein [Alkalitalea saponilacus]|uniref:Glycosyl hydrolases family 16 n=1 Tax=Alkalitalea saponilacus TaxID=889453 RepID=A0A1T5A2F6_9BACT|nr:glycoside hydrolase family 16 protein [Alkalitalea saponilacus]ASB48905.1 glycoside hydrolase [Alkalitalea saponilacus]SKB28947.1 Glycosyl hydrolases family 16 [Alkalitalea saponilacus]